MCDAIDEQKQNELLLRALLNAKSSRREDNIDAINVISRFPTIQERTFSIFSLWNEYNVFRIRENDRWKVRKSTKKINIKQI